jgi:Ca2+-binding EF-hand superfamily protein
MSRMNHINTKAEVIEAFRVFDKDGKCVGDGLYLIVNQQDCGLTHWHCVMW